jgi:hypothetical protein
MHLFGPIHLAVTSSSETAEFRIPLINHGLIEQERVPVRFLEGAAGSGIWHASNSGSFEITGDVEGGTWMIDSDSSLHVTGTFDAILCASNLDLSCQPRPVAPNIAVGGFGPNALLCKDGDPDDGDPCDDCVGARFFSDSCPRKRSRFLSFSVPPGTSSCTIQVQVVSAEPSGGAGWSTLEGEAFWVGPPTEFCDASSPSPPCAPGRSIWATELQCEPFVSDWAATADVLEIFGDWVVPNSEYELLMECDDPPGFSHQETLRTLRWGDVDGPPAPNFGDISAIVDRFRTLALAVTMLRTNISGPVTPAGGLWVNFDDIARAVDAFRSIPYPGSVPELCP